MATFEISNPLTNRNARSFDIGQYLVEREARSSFLMIEIGHLENPVVTKQSNLAGQRGYIGVESWLRDPLGLMKPRIIKLGQDLAGQNVAFMDNPLKCIAVSEDESSSNRLRGKYDPATLLPNRVADELIFSNVFGDPHIALRRGSTRKLLREAARLLDSAGKIIIRETITPHFADLGSKKLKRAGLVTLGECAIGRPANEWAALEAVFNGDDQPRLSPLSFYTILGRA